MHISPPKGDDCPQRRGYRPGPAPGAAPPPLPLRFWAVPPATCHQGEVFVKTMGSFSRSERSGSRLLAGGQLLAVVHGATPKGEASGRESPARYSASGSKTLSLGGGEAAPKSPAGSRLSVGKCSESTYRRKWQNGGMAHFAIPEGAEAQRWRSIAP